MQSNSRKKLCTLLKRTFVSKVGTGGIAGSKITGVLRFYKEVNVKDVKDNAYAVTLDGKTVKTPGRNQLELPTRSMAFAVASEWDAQKHDIRPSTMPLMTLAATSIDLDPISGPKDLINEMIQYLHSDTICYQVTVDQQEKLAVIQQKKWDPIRKWFVEEFDGEVDVNHGSIHALRHDPAVVENVSKELKKLNIFQLASLRIITKECKSLITALALFKRRITAKEAMDISRVEEEFQIGRWGLVEGGHDLDRVNCTVSLSSASFFLWMSQDLASV